MSVKCKCPELDLVIIGNDETSPLLDSTELEELEWEPNLWATLNRCVHCEQLWHVDIAKPNEIGLCIKVESAEHWKKLDSTQARIQLMVHNRGGLSDEPCRWKSCDKKAVKGLAFCPEHAYFEMDIKI